MGLQLKYVALVLEGGGFRAMFSAGVLDAFLKHNIHFPYGIGVSAGAAYGISYLSRQMGRNREVNLKYTSHPRYMGLKNLWRKGNLFDWDFVYHDIPTSYIPLDYDRAFSCSTEFNIGMTNALTGEAEYRRVSDMDKMELIRVLTASSSLPFVSKVVDYRGVPYMDGGINDSIPIRKALDDGSERLVVVLTRNRDYRKAPPRFKALFRWYYRKYPRLAQAMLTRYQRYNQSLELLTRLEEEGKAFVISPPSPMQVSRIENNPEKLDQLYLQGLEYTDTRMADLKQWLMPVNGAH